MISILIIWSVAATFLEPFERIQLIKFESYLKQLKLLSLSSFFTSQVQVQVRSKTRLNACILGLNALRDLVSPPDCAFAKCRQGLVILFQNSNTFIAYHTSSSATIGFYKNMVLPVFH